MNRTCYLIIISVNSGKTNIRDLFTIPDRNKFDDVENITIRTVDKMTMLITAVSYNGIAIIC